MCSPKHSQFLAVIELTRMTGGLYAVLLCSVALTAAQVQNTGFAGVAKKIYYQCAAEPDMFKCLKIHALKIADRALRSRAFSIVDGVTVVREQNASARSLSENSPLTVQKLEKLDSEQLDGLLMDTTARFLDTHRVQVNVPRLIEEARGKDKGMKYMGPMMAMLAIKGSFLAMAYKAIAAMAGTALIVGKIALVLSAVLGLKKLISSGSEKTTFEIVKIPQHTQHHSYSSSYEDDGHYHRSLSAGEDVNLQQRAYRGYKYSS